MPHKTVIAAAGNVEPGALACLRRLGFDVSVGPDGQWRAESARCVFIAEGPLTLLGLVKFHELRGDDWRPTDAEIDDMLALDNPPPSD